MTRTCESYNMNQPSKLKLAGAVEDDYLKKIRKENINFDSLLLENGVNYG